MAAPAPESTALAIVPEPHARVVNARPFDPRVDEFQIASAYFGQRVLPAMGLGAYQGPKHPGPKTPASADGAVLWAAIEAADADGDVLRVVDALKFVAESDHETARWYREKQHKLATIMKACEQFARLWRAFGGSDGRLGALVSVANTVDGDDRRRRDGALAAEAARPKFQTKATVAHSVAAQLRQAGALPAMGSGWREVIDAEVVSVTDAPPATAAVPAALDLAIADAAREANAAGPQDHARARDKFGALRRLRDGDRSGLQLLVNLDVDVRPFGVPEADIPPRVDLAAIRARRAAANVPARPPPDPDDDPDSPF